ncbi:hypothetical protein GC194_09950 [bacterium]|nr:hypothetical protein [bacterium]
MRNLKRRLYQAEQIFDAYASGEPLNLFLKKYFKLHKKYGKNDRREIADLLYAYFRTGTLPRQLNFEQSATTGYLLNYPCSKETLSAAQEILGLVLPTDFNEMLVEEKIKHLSGALSQDLVQCIFPYQLALSTPLSKLELAVKINTATSVFIRTLGDEEKIKQGLTENNIAYSEPAAQCLAVANGAKLHLLPSQLQANFYIQDLASQHTAAYFEAMEGEIWWDACCGSGGKSLLFKQQNPQAQLFASDSRKAIIKNYEARLHSHGFTPQVRPFDLLKKHVDEGISQLFDGIILDVPCSGSGTWSRSPEMMAHTKSETISDYAKKQEEIASNAFSYLKPGGKLVYITCSVFQPENEEVVAKLCKKHQLQVEKMELIHYPAHNSDILFAARLTKDS